MIGLDQAAGRTGLSSLREKVYRRGMKNIIFSFIGALVPTGLLAGCEPPSQPESQLTLYAMDCGAIDFDDMTSFSSDGRFDRQRYSLVVPCFLVRHPDGDLMWDTGLNRELYGQPGGLRFQGIHSRLTASLTDQLDMLDLEPADIDYVSVSHSHPDHIGNADLFDHATFIVSADEYAYMFSDAARAATAYFEPYAHLEGDQTVQYVDEHDVFGDGSVLMMTFPGHTPGSAILKVRLENAGTVLLTGDLITHTAGRQAKAIPTFNTDADQTRASLERFEALAASEEARVIIQHEPADFQALPKFPAGLD